MKMSEEWDDWDDEDFWYAINAYDDEDDDFYEIDIYEDIFECLNELFELVREYLNQNCSKEVFYKNE